MLSELSIHRAPVYLATALIPTAHIVLCCTTEYCALLRASFYGFALLWVPMEAFETRVSPQKAVRVKSPDQGRNRHASHLALPRSHPHDGRGAQCISVGKPHWFPTHPSLVQPPQQGSIFQYLYFPNYLRCSMFMVSATLFTAIDRLTEPC
jgi:hypothetical protein